MTHRIQDWAEQAVAQMRFPPDRHAAQKELLDHMEDARDALLARGLPEAQAEQQVLAAMGDAKTTGKLLNQAHRPLLGWLWLASRWVSIFMVVLLLLQIWSGSYEGNLRMGIKDIWNWSVMEEPCQYVDWGDVPVESGLTVEEGTYAFLLHHGTIGVTQTREAGQYWNRMSLGIQASADQLWQVFPLGLHRMEVEMSNGRTFSARNRQAEGEACLLNLNYEDHGLPCWNVHLFVEYYTDAPVEWMRLYVPGTAIDFTVWANGEVTG